MNIILCGLPMCGKSVVGKAVASKLSLPFVDTDLLIEAAYKSKYGFERTCSQICSERGESFFRDMEKEQLCALKDLSHSVISLGGGFLSDNDNAATVLKLGKVVYLKADPVSLWKRTGVCGVPAYLDQQRSQEAFYILAQHRMPMLAKLCHVIVETGQHNIEGVAEQVIKKIHPGK